MRQTRDTFLHLLADNLDPSIPVHALRVDSQSPDGNLHQQNAVNVKFLSTSPNWQVGDTLVEIAVMHVDELTALSWTKAVFDIIGAAYYTPKLDYTDPANPIATGTNIFWDRKITFNPVYSENYYDYRCLLTLNHKIDS
jgi:hypothetical protein